MRQEKMMIKDLPPLPQYVLDYERERAAALDHFFARPCKARAAALVGFARAEESGFLTDMTEEQVQLVRRFVEVPY
jgi:hypothetical protein